MRSCEKVRLGEGHFNPWDRNLGTHLASHPLTWVSSGQTWPLQPGGQAMGNRSCLCGWAQLRQEEAVLVESEGMYGSIWFYGQSSRRVLPLADI